MPIPNTPKPAFPNVPLVPGVPPLPRLPGVAAASTTIIQTVADAANILTLFSGPQWGLFTQDGAPAFSVIPGLSVLGGFVGGLVSGAIRQAGGGGISVGSVEYRNDSRISTAPQEEGAFLSYNKVATPFDGRVTYIISGLAAARGAFLASVKSLQASLTLLTLVMPEYSYPSCNIVHNDLRRSARDGVSMIAVDIWVQEVRITGTAAFSNTQTQTPAGAAQVSGGTVQPRIPLASQTPPPIPSSGGALVPMAGVS